MYKGHDKASIALVPVQMDSNDDAHTNTPIVIDEIQKYIDSSYVGAAKAVWRIMSFPMCNRHCSIHDFFPKTIPPII